MVSTHLKNISQTGSSPQVGVKTKKYLKPPPRSVSHVRDDLKQGKLSNPPQRSPGYQTGLCHTTAVAVAAPSNVHPRHRTSRLLGWLQVSQPVRCSLRSCQFPAHEKTVGTYWCIAFRLRKGTRNINVKPIIWNKESSWKCSRFQKIFRIIQAYSGTFKSKSMMNSFSNS